MTLYKEVMELAKEKGIDGTQALCEVLEEKLAHIGMAGPVGKTGPAGPIGETGKAGPTGPAGTAGIGGINAKK